MTFIRRLNEKTVLLIAVSISFIIVGAGFYILLNCFSNSLQGGKGNADERNEAIEIAIENYDVKKRLDEYVAEGYVIENLVEHLSQARYQVIFQASRMDEQDRLLGAYLVVVTVDVDSGLVLDLRDILSHYTMQMAIQRSKRAKVTQVFLQEFRYAEYRVGFEVEERAWVTTWEFEERIVKILVDLHGWIQSVRLLNWDVRRPEIIVDQLEAVEISRETERVQHFLMQHPDATFQVGKLYIENSTVFYVTEDWIVLTIAGGPVPEEISGTLRGNYCWTIHWFDPKSVIPHVVYVYVDVETGGVLSVTEAW